MNDFLKVNHEKNKLSLQSFQSSQRLHTFINEQKTILVEKSVQKFT